MAQSRYILLVEGLIDEDFSDPAKINRALSAAVNKAAGEARNRSAKLMLEQTAFPESYLQGQNSRLKVTTYATPGRAEAIVTGRQAPTSLARFVTGKARNGLRVTVKPGTSKLIPNSFLMKLKSGSSATGNLGLAVRVKRSGAPRGAFKPTKINDRLWLLYGPSVDQVFKTVREDVSPKTAEIAQQEFFRLLDVEGF